MTAFSVVMASLNGSFQAKTTKSIVLSPLSSCMTLQTTWNEEEKNRLRKQVVLSRVTDHMLIFLAAENKILLLSDQN